MSVEEQRAEAGFYRLVVFGAVIGNDSGVAGAGDDESGVLDPAQRPVVRRGTRTDPPGLALVGFLRSCV